MEGSRISKKALTYTVHFPTFFLIVGYLLYWGELYLFSPHKAVTSPIAWIVLLCLFLFIAIKEHFSLVDALRKIISDFQALNGGTQIYLLIGGTLCFLILLISFYASRLPPHLSQEFDVINYHITIPRQHLITGSFQHLRWSSADLFLLPMDFAFAPFWLVTFLPNKWPQFFFLIGLIFVCWSLAKRLSGDHFLTKVLVVFAVLGTHCVGIQAGTAMMGLAEAYLFLACIDSFLRGNIVLAGIEGAFYVWSKSFVPLQVILILLAIIVCYYLLKRMYAKDMTIGLTENYLLSGTLLQENLRKFKWAIAVFGLVSIFVGGPFVLKSLYYSGTPLYPFGAGMAMVNRNIDQSSLGWKDLINNSRQLTNVKDAYGFSRSVMHFIEHFWLIAVPEDSVNNRFDYPVGLVYLLCLGPFIFLFIRSLYNKQFLICHFWVVMGWLCWWMGSQQSRFLYVPLFLMLIAVISIKKFQTKVFCGCIFIALVSTTISVYNANVVDFRRTSWEVLRKEDQELIQMSKSISKDQPIVLQRQDIAFADFPVSAVESDEILVLHF